ncbi:MAG: protein phosphatase CheZ [Rhodospirillaceae bacterium]
MSNVKAGLETQIRKALSEKTIPPQLGNVGSNVGTLMSSWPSDKGLYVELKRLAAFIEQTKAEIAALRPDEVKLAFLPKATDELDAIVKSTAEATNRIMDAAEVISGVADKIDAEGSGKLMDAVTSIYEACSFQDITGQRITKVVTTLKVIESRIDQMIFSAGAPDESVVPINVQPPPGIASDSDLLNGPALPGQGRSQEEIDALLGF